MGKGKSQVEKMEGEMGEGKEDGMPFKEIEVLYSVAKVTVTY
jgi:hypothetical protein